MINIADTQDLQTSQTSKSSEQIHSPRLSLSQLSQAQNYLPKTTYCNCSTHHWVFLDLRWSEKLASSVQSFMKKKLHISWGSPRICCPWHRFFVHYPVKQAASRQPRQTELSHATANQLLMKRMRSGWGLAMEIHVTSIVTVWYTLPHALVLRHLDQCYQLFVCGFFLLKSSPLLITPAYQTWFWCTWVINNALDCSVFVVPNMLIGKCVS